MNRTVNSAVIILVSILIFLGTETRAQKSLVDQKLKEYNIPDDFFIDNLSEENATHTFKTSIGAVLAGTCMRADLCQKPIFEQ